MTELDPQAEAMLEMMESENVPAIQSLSTAGARTLLRDLFIRDNKPEVLPDDVSMENMMIPGPESEIPIRIYRPEDDGPHPALLYIHGGGWVIGGLDEYDDVCAKLASAADCAVVSVDYRLAPEHPFPAAVEDSYAAALWMEQNADLLNADPNQLVIGGDSAGGNLTAATTLMVRDHGGPTFAQQLLIYPAVNPPELTQYESYEENGEGYFLEYESMEWFYERYIQDPTETRNEYAFPLLARDLSDLPPATVITAGFDPLRDEGMEYADRLEAAGVPVDHQHYDGMIHGFVSLSEEVDVGQAAIEHLADRIET